MRSIFLILILNLIIFLNSSPTDNINQQNNNTNINQQINENDKTINNTDNKESDKINNTSIINPEKNKTEEKEFNLTESLINFFNEMFGSSNKTNDTKTEEQKLEEKRKEEQKKQEEENKRKILEQLNLEKQKEEQKKREKKLQLEREREEFEKKIENISISEFINLYLESKRGELLFHNTTKPCEIKIIFMLTDTEKNIHMTFSGPNGKGGSSLIQSFRNKNFLYYTYDAKYVGQYTFYLNNFHNPDETEVIFAVADDSKKTEEKLEKKKIDKISEYLGDIDAMTNTLSLKQNLVNRKTDKHNQSVDKHNKKIMIYSIIEVVTMIVVFILQTCYIKKIVGKI